MCTAVRLPPLLGRLPLIAALTLSSLGASCPPSPATMPVTPVLKGVSMSGQAADITSQPIQATSSQYVVVTVEAPSAGDMRVGVSPSIGDIERVVASPGRERQLADQGLPFFVVDNIDVNSPVPIWTLRISPPPLEQCGLIPFTIAVRHVVGSSQSQPLNIGFMHADSFRALGASGRKVVLRRPRCSAIDELRLERRSGSAPFAAVTPPFAGNSPADLFSDVGLTPSTAYDYRLTFVRHLGQGMKADLAAVNESASTTALLSGDVLVTAWQPERTNDPHHWRAVTADEAIRGAPTSSIGAVITRVQNEEDRDVFVTFEDSIGARRSAVEIKSQDSNASDFGGMRLQGVWDPIQSTGSAVGLPGTWQLRVFWREP